MCFLLVALLTAFLSENRESYALSEKETEMIAGQHLQEAEHLHNFDKVTQSYNSENDDSADAFEIIVLDNRLKAKVQGSNITYFNGYGRYDGAIGERARYIAEEEWRTAQTGIAGKSCVHILAAAKSADSFYYVMVTDGNNKILLKDWFDGTADATLDIFLQIPDNAVKLYLMRYSTAKCLPGTNPSKKPPIRLRIMSVNCGAFKYNNKNISTEQYMSNWRQMLRDYPADVIGLEDYRTVFVEDNNKSEEVLFGDTLMQPLVGNRYELACGNKNGELTCIDCFSVGGENSSRNMVLHCEYTVQDTTFQLFIVHLQPDINKADIRKKQYCNLIQKINKFKNVIILGDFNSYGLNEYDDFLFQGYKIANGAYTDVQNTLRDLPADNFVFSSNLVLVKFQVVTEYDLNTDHFPIYCELLYENNAS